MGLDYRMGKIESKFADLIWKHAPIRSTDLVTLAREELGWKKSTTYTVLRKLCEKGIFENTNAVVRVVQTRKDFYSGLTDSILEDAFGGSLPAFLAAFTTRRKLTKEEINEIRSMIDDFEEE